MSKLVYVLYGLALLLVELIVLRVRLNSAPTWATIACILTVLAGVVTAVYAGSITASFERRMLLIFALILLGFAPFATLATRMTIFESHHAKAPVYLK